MDSQQVWKVFRYHDETKHHYARHARSLGYLDWENQPNPFRTYEGTSPVLLPLLKEDPHGRHADLYERARNTSWDFTLEGMGAFLELSLGLSAWKMIPEGNRWALRMNPSSGNLHPTEAHLILPGMDGAHRFQSIAGTKISGGIYHYNAYNHALEPRVLLTDDFGARLRSHFQSPGFLIALTSISWREAWKYGERALRYCSHDAGHALAALSFAGNLLGWRVTCLTTPSTEDIETLLGFPKLTWPTLQEERAEMLAFVSPARQRAIPRTVPQDVLNAFAALSFEGVPSSLSRSPIEWEMLRETEALLLKPRTPEASVRFETSSTILLSAPEKIASHLIRHRRSAVAMDGKTSVTLKQFLNMLDKTLPRNSHAPFDVELGEPLVNLFLFVHRVEGLEAGLYFWLRNSHHLLDFRARCDKTFTWDLVPSSAHLFHLKSGDFQTISAQLSCGQEIAGNGAFSLGMVAQFRPIIEREPWRYPQLFWETGMIGQVLYLEAEACGVSATGIGCFYDDPVHELLGFKTNAYQSLYHFTVGGSLEDSRLQTIPAYAHLPVDRR